MSIRTTKTTFSIRSFLVITLTLAAVFPLRFSAQQTASQQTPTPERLRAHVTYLASDKLEGRRTGTNGANAAAEYIAKEFADLKLKPGAVKSSYRQSFPYVAGVELGKTNRLEFSDKGTNLRVGEDWTPTRYFHKCPG